jgi:hypothetical protein
MSEQNKNASEEPLAPEHVVVAGSAGRHLAGTYS